MVFGHEHDCSAIIPPPPHTKVLARFFGNFFHKKFHIFYLTYGEKNTEKPLFIGQPKWAYQAHFDLLRLSGLSLVVSSSAPSKR